MTTPTTAEILDAIERLHKLGNPPAPGPGMFSPPSHPAIFQTIERLCGLLVDRLALVTIPQEPVK